MKIAFAVLFGVAALVFLWLAQAGDNPDARALASLFYYPAAGCGVVAVLMAVWAW